MVENTIFKKAFFDMCQRVGGQICWHFNKLEECQHRQYFKDKFSDICVRCWFGYILSNHIENEDELLYRMDSITDKLNDISNAIWSKHEK